MGAVTQMSLAEFERLEGPDHIELLKGELIRLPPPQRRHMEICERLYEQLKTTVERSRQSAPDINVGKVHVEMGYVFHGEPNSWLRPDVSLTHPGQRGDRYYEGAPLIAFEVVSESDTAAQLEAKVALYLANGASEVWVIYPETRHAWVYQQSAPATSRETKSIRSPLLPEIVISLDDIL